MKTLPPGMIRCEVEQLSYGPIVVRFPDYPNKELFFQTDWDQASFANSCGLVKTESPIAMDFVTANLEDIEFCTDEYLTITTPIQSEE